MATDLAPEAFDLSTTDAARYLSVNPQTLKRWAKAGKVRSFRTPGGWYRFRKADLDYLTSRSQ